MPDPTHIANCPECGTKVKKESTEEAIEVVERHNEERHDGEQVAGIGHSAMAVPQFTEEEKEKIRGAVSRIASERDG